MTEEFKDIIAGLEQRIHIYKSKLHDFQKKRDKLEEEIKTTKKYLELAETLYRVEIEKVRLSQSAQQPAIDMVDRSNELLMERTKYAGLSIPQATCMLLAEKGEPLHAKDIFQKLMEGGVRIRGKTPVTSVAISLSRDKRFKKVAPNTFQFSEEAAINVLPEKNTSPSGVSSERG